MGVRAIHLRQLAWVFAVVHLTANRRESRADGRNQNLAASIWQLRAGIPGARAELPAQVPGQARDQLEPFRNRRGGIAAGERQLGLQEQAGQRIFEL
jgi:hypothetical protein